MIATRAQQPNPAVSQVQSLIRAKELDEAVQTAKASLRKTPADYRLWTLEGIALSIMGNQKDALAAFDAALRISPSYTPALKGEVQLLCPQGDARAIPLLARILKVDAHDVTAHEMLAVLERKQGKCRSANEHFALTGEAIKAHRESLEAYGYCLVDTKQFEKAASTFEQLVFLIPNEAYPKYDLAVVLFSSRQNEAALKVLEPLLSDDQKDPDILSLGSQAYEAVGNTPKAVALLRQAIVLSPATAGYYVAFADICLSHDSFQVGIDMINAGLQRLPNDATMYLSRGLLFAQLAQYDQAEADFNRAEQLDSGQILSSYALDLTEVQKNNPDEALAKVRSQLKVHPDSAMLNFLLAQLLMNEEPAAGSEAPKEAMRAALRVVKLKPDHAGAHDLLASMYMRTGQYNLAIEQCRIALQYAPSDETATYHLVIALRHAGKSDELPALVKRLSQLHQDSRKQETDRKSYRLVEASSAPASEKKTEQ